MGLSFDQLSETRRIILHAIKRDGPTTILELASKLTMTREAIRQQLLQLEHEGWIEKHSKRDKDRFSGRPSMYYSLTKHGEHLYPKNYDALTVELLDTVAEQLGADVLIQILGAMTQARIREWEPRVKGLDLEKKIEALKGLYAADDAFMEVEHAGEQLRLIERNCPFFNVAQKRPVLCSVTISVLSHILGFRVEREESFQNGDGRCAFRVMLDQPLDSNSSPFAIEA